MEEGLKARLLDNIKKVQGPLETECWEWTGTYDSDGYGRLKINGRQFSAHRLAFEVFVGPIPEDKPCVCHHCDNPPCINPDHLFVGTHQDNADDKVAKDRQAKGELSGRAIYTENDVTEIRSLAAKGYDGVDIAYRLGMSKTHARDIIRGERWRHLPGAVVNEKKYHGVYYKIRDEKWIACLRIEGKRTELGRFGFMWDALICVNYHVAYLDLDLPLNDIATLSQTLPRLIGERCVSTRLKDPPSLE